jgi:two-component system CheB/CheR fusion protein
LDSNLHIKHFTPQARDMFHLMQADIGRPLSDMASVFTDNHLVLEAQDLLNTLEGKDQEVQTAAGTWYLMRMRPYHTAQNVIDGVVMSFIDITRLKHAMEARREGEA